MQQRAQAMAESLSERERQLVVLASKGLTDTAIAHRLGISLATVGTYWGRVRIKFGPLNRTELVALFLQEHATLILESLKQENQGLLDQIEEQSRNVEVMQTKLDLFNGLIETAPHAILIVSETGEIQLANPQCERMFGFEPGEMLELTVEELVPEQHRRSHVDERKVYRQNPVKRKMGEHLATYAIRKDGSQFPMAAVLSATESSSGFFTTCVIQDLTDTLLAFSIHTPQGESMAE